MTALICAFFFLVGVMLGGRTNKFWQALLGGTAFGVILLLLEIFMSPLHIIQLRNNPLQLPPQLFISNLLLVVGAVIGACFPRAGRLRSWLRRL